MKLQAIIPSIYYLLSARICAQHFPIKPMAEPSFLFPLYRWGKWDLEVSTVNKWHGWPEKPDPSIFRVTHPLSTAPCFLPKEKDAAPGAQWSILNKMATERKISVFVTRMEWGHNNKSSRSFSGITNVNRPSNLNWWSSQCNYCIRKIPV